PIPITPRSLHDALPIFVPGGADVGQALVSDPHVRVISFTGSTAAGRAVGEAAGRHLKRAHLELGGNSAMLVLDDADVEQAVNLADRKSTRLNSSHSQIS